MIKLISFPSIEQFRHIVATVKREAEFTGLDETGEAIYDETRPKPILHFVGTVKLHGTNMGVCIDSEGTIWAQSKENIITPENDNAGAAMFVKQNESVFRNLFNEIIDVWQIDMLSNSITIYGEWVGKGIQSGVAINNLDKSMFIIGIKISPNNIDEEHPAYWVGMDFLKSPEHRIYNILDYKKYYVDIDFNNPAASLDEIVKMTIEVEDECPVAKAFGFTGIGEGIVFSYDSPNKIYRFKSKGEKHAKAPKVKSLEPVDNERLQKIVDLVNKVTPDWRLEQALDKTFNILNGGRTDIKQLGVFIKNVIADIVKEEMDVIAESGLIMKDLNSKISERSRNFFFAKQNEEVGL